MAAKLTDTKTRVRQFAMLADGDVLKFRIRGTVPDARDAIQCMRVELSRQRSYVKAAGHAIRPFKMKVTSVKSIGVDTEVVLTKDASLQGIQRDIDNAFEGIAAGAQIDV